MLDYLCKEDVKQAETMWKVFWRDSLDFTRRFIRFRDDKRFDYIGALFCYYYLCFVRNDEPEDLSLLMMLFHEVKEMPILVITAIRMLLDNGLAWDMLYKADSDFFESEIKRAGSIAKEQYQYKWVLGFFKKMRLVYE